MRAMISVITVVKDDLAGLKITAASIVSQNLDNFEWQIVDGFSTDGTWEYAREFEDHPNVTLSQTPPKGIYDAMNFGAKKSNSPWLWFINAGDVLLAEEIFKRIEETISLNKHASIIASPVVYLTPSQYYYSLAIPKIIDRGSTKYAIFHHQGCILNKNIYSEAGGFDESLRFAADGKLIDSMISIAAPTIVPIVAVGFEMGGASSKNFWRSLNEIRIYRHQVLTMRSMIIYQIKEALRGLMLKMAKTKFGGCSLQPYLLRREESVVKSAALMGLELPTKHRFFGDSQMRSGELKIIEVLSASDLNVKYLNCVETYINSWLGVPVQNQIKFIPKVLIVAKSIPDNLLYFSKYLKLVDPLDMPTAFVSQTARVTEAQNSTADYVMTSDIDMLPLNLSFETSLVDSEVFDLDSFFIVRDVLEPGQYPICYNLARPCVWRSLLSVYGDDLPSAQILRVILNQYGGNSAYSGLHGGQGWTIDQQNLWNLVQQNEGSIHFEKFIDSQTKHRRLDRAHHRRFLKWLVLPLVFGGFYHDYHVHHPIIANIKYVNLVIKVRNLGIKMRTL